MLFVFSRALKNSIYYRRYVGTFFIYVISNGVPNDQDVVERSHRYEWDYGISPLRYAEPALSEAECGRNDIDI